MSATKTTAKAVVKAVEDVDRSIAKRAPAKDNVFVRTVGALGEIGDQPPMIALSIGTTVLGVARRDRRMARAGLRMVAAHMLATWSKQAIKRGIVRTRPATARKQGYRSDTGKDTDHAVSSFPSGHTAGAVAVAQAIARDYPALATPARVTAAAVAGVQIPSAKHFLSDLVVGALIALTAERLASLAVDALDRRIASPDPDQKRTQPSINQVP